MRLFWNIFGAVFASLLIVVGLASFLVIQTRISEREAQQVQATEAAAAVAVAEIAKGVPNSQWPFKTLRELVRDKGYLFWWIVEPGGRIYLADQPSFAGTRAQDYFPQVKALPAVSTVYRDAPRQYGLVIQPVPLAGGPWTLWLGYSTREGAALARSVMAGVLGFSGLGLVLLGGFLFLLIRHLLQPLNQLSDGVARLGRGDLAHRVQDRPRNELGDLARSFNEMARALQEREKQLECELAERRKAEEALRRSNRHMRMVSDCNQVLVRAANEQELLQIICRTIADVGDYASVWVEFPGAAGGTGPLTPVAWAVPGDRPAGPSPGVPSSADWSRRLADTAFRTGQPTVVGCAVPEVVAVVDASCPASCAALPLVWDSQPLGVLLIQAAPPGAFDEEELTLLMELAGDLAYGLRALRTQTEKQATEEALTRSQEQLLQAQKMEALGRLAGGVAHDFNNLLTPILGFSHLALDKIPPDNSALKDIREVVRSGERAAELTRQLLAVGRKRFMEVQPLSVNESVTAIEPLLRRSVGEDIEIQTDLDESIGIIDADAGGLDQVILNLAVNARDAMPSGGRLLIQTRPIFLGEEHRLRHPNLRPGNYVMLLVRDTGCGMSPAVLQHLFEPFFTTKEQGKGTGLGLSTLYGIVQQFHGHIDVTSAPGMGAEFRLYFPVVIAAVSRSALPAESVLPGGTETVLVVEDEEMVRLFTVQVLRLLGYQVLEARNGPEALEVGWQRREPIHLVFTDIVMPKMSGPETVTRLQQIRTDFKVLYATGYSQDVVVHHGGPTPGAALILKPYTREALARKLRQVLDGTTPAPGRS